MRSAKHDQSSIKRDKSGKATSWADYTGMGRSLPIYVPHLGPNGLAELRDDDLQINELRGARVIDPVRFAEQVAIADSALSSTADTTLCSIGIIVIISGLLALAAVFMPRMNFDAPPVPASLKIAPTVVEYDFGDTGEFLRRTK